MKLQVKFDMIQNLDKQMEDATEEELGAYRENKEEFFDRLVDIFKQALQDELNCDDYCWVENLDVKVVEE